MVKPTSPGPLRPSASSGPRHAVSRATGAAPGQGSDTVQSSEWLAERESPARPPPGVPLDTAGSPPSPAIESKRGSHKSG
jgi:hypothetical protein